MLGIPVSPLCDRPTTSVAGSQVAKFDDDEGDFSGPNEHEENASSGDDQGSDAGAASAHVEVAAVYTASGGPVEPPMRVEAPGDEDVEAVTMPGLVARGGDAIGGPAAKAPSADTFVFLRHSVRSRCTSARTGV